MHVVAVLVITDVAHFVVVASLVTTAELVLVAMMEVVDVLDKLVSKSGIEINQ
jgi:hypothetical protein